MSKLKNFLKKTFFFSILALLLLNQIFGVNAKELYVDKNKGEEYQSIQSAIDNSTDGDTIFVNKGIYIENLEIDKKIKIIGLNNPTLTCSTNDISAVNIRKDSIKFSGFKITGNCNSAIKISSNYNIIEKCVISNSSYGIFIFSSNYNTIKKNTIRNTTNTGLNFFSSNDNEIFVNNIIHNKNGIGFLNSKDNYILGNKIDNNYEKGVKLISSNKNIFEKNNISYNNLTGFSISHSCDNNIIFCNNFINNSLQAEDYGKNFWYNEDEKVGNYWSNYFKIYSNATFSKNIWNKPYSILKGENKDIYPAVSVFNINIKDNIFLDNGKENTFFYMLFLAPIVFFIFVIYIIKKKG